MPKPVGVKDECPKGRDAPAARLAKAALEEAASRRESGEDITQKQAREIAQLQRPPVVICLEAIP